MGTEKYYCGHGACFSYNPSDFICVTTYGIPSPEHRGKIVTS